MLLLSSCSCSSYCYSSSSYYYFVVIYFLFRLCLRRLHTVLNKLTCPSSTHLHKTFFSSLFSVRRHPSLRYNVRQTLGRIAAPWLWQIFFRSYTWKTPGNTFSLLWLPSLYTITFSPAETLTHSSSQNLYYPVLSVTSFQSSSYTQNRFIINYYFSLL